LPAVITVDNGPELAGKALDAWTYQKGIKLYFIRPGKPVENAYIESFNGKQRDECLNENLFRTLDEARVIIETWRLDYNQYRSHSSLGNLTPRGVRQSGPGQTTRTAESEPMGGMRNGGRSYLNERLDCCLGNHLMMNHPEIKAHLTTRVSAGKVTVKCVAQAARGSPRVSVGAEIREI